MPNLLIVTLDNEAKPPCLKVDEKDHPNHVEKNADWQTIRWKLEGNAADGSFNSQTDPKPGFAWVGVNRAEGIFGEPVLRGHGKVLSISVLNDNNTGDDDDTTGEWIYRLNATIGGKPYQTNPTTDDGRTTTSPRIKNT